MPGNTWNNANMPANQTVVLDERSSSFTAVAKLLMDVEMHMMACKYTCTSAHAGDLPPHGHGHVRGVIDAHTYLSMVANLLMDMDTFKESCT